MYKINWLLKSSLKFWPLRNTEGQIYTNIMKTLTKTELYIQSPEQVFNCIDDLGVTGMHMTKSSAMMFGSKLVLEFLTAKHSGAGSKYKWNGKMMGWPMDFTVEVTKWIPPEEKIWETIGEAKLIIYSWYRMHLKITPVNNGVEACLSISYERPKDLFSKILSFLFADLWQMVSSTCWKMQKNLETIHPKSY